MKITAVKGKSSVFVLAWGNAPFAKELTKRGAAIVPNGFKVEVKSDSKIWVAETRVERSLPYYRFSLKDDPAMMSDWRDNPTAAYKEASERCGNEKFSKGSNGRLIIGITYENLQNEIQTRFSEQLKRLPGMLDGLVGTNSVPDKLNRAITDVGLLSSQHPRRKRSKLVNSECDHRPDEPEILSVSQILLDISSSG